MARSWVTKRTHWSGSKDDHITASSRLARARLHGRGERTSDEDAAGGVLGVLVVEQEERPAQRDFQRRAFAVEIGAGVVRLELPAAAFHEDAERRVFPLAARGAVNPLRAG